MTEELRALLERVIKHCGGNGSEADRRAGFREGTFAKWASGQTRPSIESLRRIADAFAAEGDLGVTLRALMLAAGYPTPEPPPDPAAPDPVPPDVRVYWSRVQDEYGPEEREVARAMDRLAQRAAEDFRNRRRALGLPSKGYAPPADLGA